MRLRSMFPLPCVALVAVLACASSAFAAPPVALATYGVDEIVADRSLTEWSEAYLQWIASFTRDSSPVSDTTGALCAAKQDGDVWFLAASDGTGPVVRSCVVPAAKPVFVPVAITMERSGNKEPDCPSMARIAAATLTQHVHRITLTIDGQGVDNLASYRVDSGDCFALGLRQVPRSAARTAVADGYAVMLKPLAPGMHTIEVASRFDSTPVSTTYHLDVH